MPSQILVNDATAGVRAASRAAVAADCIGRACFRTLIFHEPLGIRTSKTLTHTMIEKMIVRWFELFLFFYTNCQTTTKKQGQNRLSKMNSRIHREQAKERKQANSIKTKA